VWKLPTSTQLRATWHTDSLDMVVLPSIGASRYHNCCIDGGTSPEYFECTLLTKTLCNTDCWMNTVQAGCTLRWTFCKALLQYQTLPVPQPSNFHFPKIHLVVTLASPARPYRWPPSNRFTHSHPARLSFLQNIQPLLHYRLHHFSTHRSSTETVWSVLKSMAAAPSTLLTCFVYLSSHYFPH
jgi:hypothetical protein